MIWVGHDGANFGQNWLSCWENTAHLAWYFPPWWAGSRVFKVHNTSTETTKLITMVNGPVPQITVGIFFVAVSSVYSKDGSHMMGLPVLVVIGSSSLVPQQLLLRHSLVWQSSSSLSSPTMWCHRRHHFVWCRSSPQIHAVQAPRCCHRSGWWLRLYNTSK